MVEVPVVVVVVVLRMVVVMLVAVLEVKGLVLAKMKPGMQVEG